MKIIHFFLQQQQQQQQALYGRFKDKLGEPVPEKDSPFLDF